MTIDEALGHIGAYIEGGDELGAINEADASEAYDVICGELANLRRQLAETLGKLDICRLSLAASEQARVQAEEMANVLRIRLALDKPPPPPTCGHRGMAGSVGCILPAGHPGEHEYRAPAER